MILVEQFWQQYASAHVLCVCCMNGHEERGVKAAIVATNTNYEYSFISVLIVTTV